MMCSAFFVFEEGVIISRICGSGLLYFCAMKESGH